MAALTMLGMGAFVIVCVAVGGRLLALARRTRGLPESVMGACFLLIGALGYGLVASAGWAERAGSAWLPWLWGGGLLAISAGCACVAFFTWHVFRPDAAGRAIWLGLVLVAFGGLLGHGLAPGFGRIGLHGPWAWLAYAGRIGCLGWAAAESFLYAARVQRQLRIGLGDPEVGRRCFWWGVGAAAACGVFLRNGVAEFWRLPNDFTSPAVAIPTVTLGLIASGAILRAFFVRGRPSPQPVS